MRFGRSLLSSALTLATATSCFAATVTHHGPTSHKVTARHAKVSAKPVGQRVIDDTRATQIQNSLIRSGYLSGEASGHWDTQTEAAMQKFQSDNGWQTKLIPDSRAIIKLGLGPSQTAEITSSPSATMPAPQAAAAEGFMQK